MKTLIAFFVMTVLAAPALARSADGFIVADTALQSGPDYDYPPVDQLTVGTPVIIEGCVEGWIWCDVSAGDLRGWVPGTYIEQNYAGRWVYIIDYGPRIGLPVVVFSLNTYWGAHYHDRPWFAERDRWATRPIHPRAPAHLAGEAHAPPQRPTRPAAPETNARARPSAMPQTNPGNPAKAGTQSVEPDRLRKVTPPVSGGTRVPNSPERTAPTEPMVEPAHRAQLPAPKSTPLPQPKPEAKPKPKTEPKAPIKENPEHREENNGHDHGSIGVQSAAAERSILNAARS